MTKYSNEFKVKAIKMVLKGNSISHVAKIPKVGHKTTFGGAVFL